MNLGLEFYNSLSTYSDRTSCVINDEHFSYKQLAQAVSNIRSVLRSDYRAELNIIGLVTNDDLETYAGIIAIWLEGKAYVPLSPDSPVQRNNDVIQQAGIKTIIDSENNTLFKDFDVIASRRLEDVSLDIEPVEVDNQALAYILFTSGTTGSPKGVPITRSNVEAYIQALEKSGYVLTHNDRCLQMFELTFDFSVMAYLFPLIRGASMYTIPKGETKFSYIYQLMNKHKLTALPMVPSVINFLRPFFGKISDAEVRYSIFCGEALQTDVVKEWSRSIPEANIYNYYGPTECTVFCSYYKLSTRPEDEIKTFNGVVSIGQAMVGTELIIIDDDNQPIVGEGKGELCIASTQLTPGYWNSEEKNASAFFNLEMDENEKRYYKTGDLCMFDSSGDYYYLGRIDFQTKVNGFRVELSEIEFHAKMYLSNTNCVAIAWKDVTNNSQIGLVIEDSERDIDALLNYLKRQMPPYMIPIKIIFMTQLPYNNSGKTDRMALLNFFNGS